MSLEINSDNDYFVRTGSANLGSVTSGSCAGWYYKNDSTNQDLALVFSKSGTASSMRTASATEMRYRVGTNDSSTFAANNGTWMKLAMTVTAGGDFIGYAAPAGSPLVQVFEFDSTNVNEITTISGGQNGGTFTSARGSYRYFRYWAGRVLTLEELEAEFAMTPSSGTPAASVTNLYLSWPLPDGTTTTDWGSNSAPPTISGAATSLEEPTIGGASIPIAAIASMNRRGAEWF